MDEPIPASWRELAEAVVNEDDPENLSTLVEQLCKAIDAGRAAATRKVVNDHHGD